VVHIGWRNSYRVLMGKPKGKDCLEDPGVYRMVILTWNLQKLAVIAWIGFIWLGTISSGGLL